MQAAGADASQERRTSGVIYLLTRPDRCTFSAGNGCCAGSVEPPVGRNVLTVTAGVYLTSAPSTIRSKIKGALTSLADFALMSRPCLLVIETVPNGSYLGDSKSCNLSDQYFAFSKAACCLALQSHLGPFLCMRFSG